MTKPSPSGRRILSDDEARKIVKDTRPSHVVAAEYLISSSLVRSIRIGRRYKQATMIGESNE